MLYEAITHDTKPGPTPFSIYCWFITWILLAASFDTVVQTNGQWTFSVTNVCSGLGQCSAVRNTPIYNVSAPPQATFFPCDRIKSLFEGFLPLNIIAFILSVFVFCANMGQGDHEFGGGVAYFINMSTLMIIGCTGLEALLVLYVHLGDTCVFPGREKDGLLSMRHGLGKGTELGPTFALLGTALLFEVTCLFWTNRRWLRSKCSLFEDCGGWKKKVERAKTADDARKRKQNQFQDDSAAMSMLTQPGGESMSRRKQAGDSGSGPATAAAAGDDKASFQDFFAPPTGAVAAGHGGAAPAAGYQPPTSTAAPVNPMNNFGNNMMGANSGISPIGASPAPLPFDIGGAPPAGAAVAVPQQQQQQQSRGLDDDSSLSSSSGEEEEEEDDESDDDKVLQPEKKNLSPQNPFAMKQTALAASGTNKAMNKFRDSASPPVGNSSVSTGKKSSGGGGPRKPFALRMLERRQKKEEEAKRKAAEAAAAAAQANQYDQSDL